MRYAVDFYIYLQRIWLPYLHQLEKCSIFQPNDNGESKQGHKLSQYLCEDTVGLCNC